MTSVPVTDPGPAEALLAGLRAWVECETPTDEPARVNALIDRAEAPLRAAGAAVTRIPGRDGFGDCLRARIGSPEGKGILIAGHLDTVWPAGTLARMPFRVEGDRAYGPGIYDMKAGSFLAWHAMLSILRQGTATRLPVTLLLTSDEEVGSPTSRALIEAEAREAAFVLIPEPASADGAVVTARKGVGRFDLVVRGVASHAGGNFEDGASAVVELARQILDLHAMVDPPRGVTVNVAPISGGTRPNVVAAEARAEIDLRVRTVEDGARLTAAILGLRPHDPRCTVTVTGGMNRPPFPETEATLALYARARAIAEGLGFTLPKQARGGGSDGNFTAVMGIPTLDGLGCPGAGAHADHEHILWRALAPRCRLLLGLMETLH
ncbi:M20 family metallopeptidase [Elioraea thermophila]|uniref:M20 family metallopeptidase n=1 Tax=Elioraea thermophila TaxID=2185104 RepID=UPI000DF31B96|nr:M20 family metallopeptidase [Elioraea thermophila]